MDPEILLPREIGHDPGFVGWFHEFRIPIGGVIVNMVLDRSALGADVPEFVRNRLRMPGRSHADDRREVRRQCPRDRGLFDQEVRGVAMLDRTAAALFGP